ncbi:MAG TPA: hypothetical protein VJP39_03485 [Gaiellaceae bacterium]|nr:hypothetical protein [Gaiellaceae bacterium]
MLREELRRIANWEERHRRLVARLIILLSLTVVVDAVGSVLIWATESGRGDIHGFGDAVFFTTVQLLTVSSQIKNPLTATGRVIDVMLELWAISAVAGSAGAIATFFTSGDS